MPLQSPPRPSQLTETGASLFDFSYQPNIAEAYHVAGRAPVSEEPNAPTLTEHAPRVLEDRWYQTHALREIERRLPVGTKRRVAPGDKVAKGEMLVAPTGTGKTSIATRAIRKWLDAGERVLVLVDLDRLLKQMFDDLDEQQITPLIEKARQNAFVEFGSAGKRCVLASMQSLHAERLARWPPDSFDKIVIDECHELHWLHIVAHFTAPYLGLTATPFRTDGQSLKEYFHFPYIRTLTLREAIEGWNGITRQYEHPFLARLLIKTIPAPQIDLRNIRLVTTESSGEAETHEAQERNAQDFNPRALDERIREHTNFIASAIIKHAGDRPTFVFCPKIPSANAIALALRDLGAAAAPYHSQVDDIEGVMKRFEDGELQFLTNVNMLIKGVNVRKVSCIARAKPSLALGPTTQEIGRGTRNCPESGKENCLVLEFDCNTGDKKLTSVIDAILDGADDADDKPAPEVVTWRTKVKTRTEKLLRDGEQDVLKAHQEAMAQLKREAEAKRMLRQAQEEERRRKYEQVEVGEGTIYDPCSGLDKVAPAHDSEARSRIATPEQMEQLQELSKGVIRAEDCRYWTVGSAEKRIRELENRKKYHYASEPTLRLLIALGCPTKQAQRMKQYEAGAWIETTKMEMVYELEAKGFDYEKLRDQKAWDVAKMHKQHCPPAALTPTS